MTGQAREGKLTVCEEESGDGRASLLHTLHAHFAHAIGRAKCASVECGGYCWEKWDKLISI